MAVKIGAVTVGGSAPVVVQSMTNTDTADVEGTARQTAELARAGSELVRITVDRDEAAKAVPHIRDRLDRLGVNVPLIGDFHYNGHTLLNDNPACAEALAKYRINPGNVGFKDKKDRNFSVMIETALKLGDGAVIVNEVNGKDSIDHMYSERFACAYDGERTPSVSRTSPATGPTPP